jgi:hypothetical protein
MKAAGDARPRALSKSDYRAVASAALADAKALLHRWLPDGRMRGREFVSKNPRRIDGSAGSFSVNTKTGAWSDFATGDAGGDLVSLAAYLFGQTQEQAARELAKGLGVDLT